MALFNFAGVDQSGGEHNGTLEADTLRHARSLLKSRGIVAIQVNEVKSQHKQTRYLGLFKKKLSASDRVLFLRQLASLLNAGIALDEALGTLARETEKPYVGQIILAMRSSIVAGSTLGNAFRDQSAHFPETLVALVSAGEQTGQLGYVMEKVADYAESRDQLNQKVLMALAYPAIVSFVAVGIVAFLMTHVVPQVVSVFIHNHQSLPLLTRIMIYVSDGLVNWGWLILLGIVLLVVVMRQLLRQPALRLIWDQYLLDIPLVGRLVRGYNTERFASTLAILVNSGVPILAALIGAADTLNNTALKNIITDAASRVREGSGLSRALAVYKQFPPILLQLIQSGESTGRLSEMLSRAAQTESRDLERRLLLMTTLLEPLLILFMGLVVATIVLAVMMPIMEINQMIH
ncbi:MAG: type II secretion system protein GspF [Ferrovum sp. 37-45-19]|nr:MAG: type II secretion system protein GspF [Ferrovum sp. 21-44-67]OYV94077.1 MAG: type II secretion system protein GspF [Ferrovum sp. 37-45-19]OZB33967.1 MAG: type II secretion system protein GspF [Ferrovum sp. 34-44-207]HQT82102.1 type II secretion system inner membrane protein GspF [Ferrovaceae bacterium]HQU05852.1 type II secretion system inner membrane protein GspF [Ferrovaceae bacterium]